MNNVNIFCLLARSGGGKSTIYNEILEDSFFCFHNDISPMIYGTTRKPRDGERDGVEYYFHTMEEFNNIPPDDLIEFRSYYKWDEKEVKYFTKKEYLEGKTNIICTCSPYQFIYYFNWCNKENAKNGDNKYRVYCIEISCNARERLLRTIERVPENENDDAIYEICRRILDEILEFNGAMKKLPFSNNNNLIDKDYTNYILKIDNSSRDRNDFVDQINKVKYFISSHIDD